MGKGGSGPLGLRSGSALRTQWSRVSSGPRASRADCRRFRSKPTERALMPSPHGKAGEYPPAGSASDTFRVQGFRWLEQFLVLHEPVHQ